MLRAYGALTLAGTFVFVCLKVLAGPALPSMWVLLPGMLLTSCAIHEAGHAYAARLLKVPFVFLAKPGAASILYARPGQFQEHWIALSGPLLAAILCIVVACIIGLLQLRFIAIATGLIHLYSLSPWMADGKSIWRK
jgi:hypothetical protein